MISGSLLGLTEYEERVYRALLAESPATAYRLGKLSGVPLSRVYEVATRLVEKGAAVRRSGEPARYVPVGPASLIESARNRTARRFEELADELTRLHSETAASDHEWIQGEAALLARVSTLVAGSRSGIVMAATSTADGRLKASLRSRPARTLFHAHTLPMKSRAETGFLILMDGETMVAGCVGTAAEALITRQRVLVQIAESYLQQLDAGALFEKESSSLRIPITVASDWLGWEEAKHRRLLQTH